MRLIAAAMLIMIAPTPTLAGAARAGGAGDDRSPAAVALVAAAPNPNEATYKLSGHRSVLPSSIHDDGERTYITWAPSQSIPAVFGVDERGREQLVNGFMRDGSLTIDRVYARLTFRIDDASASARRKLGRNR